MLRYKADCIILSFAGESAVLLHAAQSAQLSAVSHIFPFLNKVTFGHSGKKSCAVNTSFILLSFAACRNHVSLYADGEILETFRPELDGFVIKKNAVYLPFDRALPAKVLESIVQRCFEAE